ncbi:unnamed protein product [Menidia menidia]|uniref:(Atlantic silverside) hypothetical protein n=1 Tax=Menidia menidia TaxID=238744 RepID=A0A8S4BSJ4_9TELE|nr:unnamed protein product [Menidia menidia]
MVTGWKEVFERNRLVPASSQTVRFAEENHFNQSQGFQLSLCRLTAAHLPQEVSVGQQDVTYQLRVTLFDRMHQHFIGKTWRSSAQKMKNNKIAFNEVARIGHLPPGESLAASLTVTVLYFHTSLLLPSTLLVLELVSLLPKPDGSHQALGRGFTVLELFANRPESPMSDGDRRLNLCHGSPRGLLHPLLKDTDSSLLKVIDGAHLDCVVKRHPSLLSVMHLLPENILVSGLDDIPGLAASPTDCGDALLRPQLLKIMPYSLTRLTVSLQPSLETFESLLLQLINADCHNTKQPGSEETQKTVVIQERRLHAGVHNGWCFLDKPQVVVLEPLALGVRGRADSTSRKSTLVKDSSATSSFSQMLGLRSSLELRLVNHPTLAIVFQLEYVFSAPVGRETMKCINLALRKAQTESYPVSVCQQCHPTPYGCCTLANKETLLSATATSRAAFLQCLRWGIWCPFQEPADWKGKEIQLVLQGGANPNPHGVMVYSTEVSAQTQSPSPVPAGTAQPGEESVQPKGVTEGQAGGRVTSHQIPISICTGSKTDSTRLPPGFSPRTWGRGVFASVDLRTDLWRAWLSQDSLKVLSGNISMTYDGLHSAHSDSHVFSQKGADKQFQTRLRMDDNFKSLWVGKRLSLSQLAATSRYPTISHSSSALPWQQSFPSLLHPSPLASAHQLSHVACSAVTSIAHLEMDLQRGNDEPPSMQEEGDQLQELPFTPVHAPVITLRINAPRSSLAHLFSAGFPEIVDCRGQVAEILDPIEPLPFDLQREEADLLQGNLLVFQFLAFSRVPSAAVGLDWPSNIYITFQFYRFPPVKSQQLKLLTSDKVQHQAGVILPCVLTPTNKDGTPSTGVVDPQQDFQPSSAALSIPCTTFRLRWSLLGAAPRPQGRLRTHSPFQRWGQIYQLFLACEHKHTQHMLSHSSALPLRRHRNPSVAHRPRACWEN